MNKKKLRFELKIDEAFPSAQQSAEPLNGKNKTENLLNKLKPEPAREPGAEG